MSGTAVRDVSELESVLEKRSKITNKKRERSKKPVKKVKVSKKEAQIREIANNTILPDHYFTVNTEHDLKQMCEWLSTKVIISVDTETMGLNPFKDEIVGISVYAPNYGYYIPLRHIEYPCLPKGIVIRYLKPILEDRSKKFIFHNAKFDLHILWNNLGIDVKAYFDTMIAQALLDENQSKALKDLAPIYLKIPADKYSTLFEKVTFDRVPIALNQDRTGSLATYYAVKDVELTYKLFEFQMKYLNSEKLSKIKDLFFNVEMPFLHIVTEAERRGVRLDVDYLQNEIADQLNKEIDELAKKIYVYTGEINLNSPAQLSVALYEKMGLPRVDKDKPNSTDKRTLKKMKSIHEVAELILEYREKVKLKTAFVDKLPKTAINGRVHTSFNTVGTHTGRMSSNNPNLQQIPNGGNIRQAFIADKGRLLASVDFSQQEIRLLAHFSQDKTLLNIYKNGKDVHSKTALGMWNRKRPDQELTYEQFEAVRGLIGTITDADGNFDASLVTEEKIMPLKEAGYTDLSNEALSRLVELGKQLEKIRKNAKIVNFGIIYGMGAKKLADTLEIPVEEAETYISSYFDNYPRVKKWMAEQRKKMSSVMYTETLLGRKRRVYPELNSGEQWKIEKAFRMGINSVIQGSGADMVKKASVDLQPLLKELDVHIVLWVHDELLFDVPENIGMDNLRRIADVMCNAIPLSCGMKSDIEVGKRWGQKMSEDVLQELFDEETEEELVSWVAG